MPGPTLGDAVPMCLFSFPLLDSGSFGMDGDVRLLAWFWGAKRLAASLVVEFPGVRDANK